MYVNNVNTSTCPHAGFGVLLGGPVEGGGAQFDPGAGPGDGNQHPKGCGSRHGILAPATAHHEH